MIEKWELSLILTSKYEKNMFCINSILHTHTKTDFKYSILRGLKF